MNCASAGLRGFKPSCEPRRTDRTQCAGCGYQRQMARKGRLESRQCETEKCRQRWSCCCCRFSRPTSMRRVTPTARESGGGIHSLRQQHASDRQAAMVRGGAGWRMAVEETRESPSALRARAHPQTTEGKTRPASDAAPCCLRERMKQTGGQPPRAGCGKSARPVR